MSDVDDRAEAGTEDKDEARQAVEARAARMGWKPQDGFRGDGWLDAPDFIEKVESEIPVLRERNRKLDSDLAARDTRITQLERTVETLSTMTKRQVDAAVTRAKAEMQKAVEEGDTEGHARAQAVLDDLTKAPEPQQRQVQQQQGEHPEFASWKADNPWYGTDIKATAYADSIVHTVARVSGLQAGKALYDKVAEAVKEEMPERFENKRRDTPQSVEEGGRRPNGGGGRRFQDIPAADRRAMERQADDLQIPKEERKAHFEEVAKIYWDAEA